MDDDSENMIPDSEEPKKPGLLDKAQDAKEVVDTAKDIKKGIDSLKTTGEASKVAAGTTSTAATTGTSAAAAGGTAAGAAGGTAAGGAAAAGGTAAAAGGAVGGLGIAAIVLIVVILVFLLIGIIVSLVYIPGSIEEQVKGFFKKIFKSVGGFFVGEDAMLDNDEFSEVANILQSRGYDLYAEGYINKQFDPEEDLDADGNVKKLPEEIREEEFPHLIELYTRMDSYTYRARNVTWTQKLFSKQDMRGFLNFKTADWDDGGLRKEKNYDEGLFKENIKIDRNQGLLKIKKNLLSEPTVFKTEGWTGRYGLPLELFVALHQGTRAPDLVREIAKGAKAYTDKDHNNESIEFFDQTSSDDVLYYAKPVLDILLIDTEIETIVNFLIPDGTTINGSVYVLNKDIEIGELYDSNPYAGLTDADFTVKSKLTKEETYKAFFKTSSGKFVQIRPVNNPFLNYSNAFIPLNDNGTPVFNLVEPVEKLVGGQTVIKYKVKAGMYDFSSLYFTNSGGEYIVNNLKGQTIKTSPGLFDRIFIDKNGLYDIVTEVIENNPDVSNFNDFCTKLKEIFDLASTTNTYIPMIKNSTNHWFRDIYFYLDNAEEYVLEDKGYFLLTGEKWSEYGISEDQGKKILTPATEKVETKNWFAYDIHKTDNPEDALGMPLKTDEPAFKGFSKYVYINESQTVTAAQKQEGRRGMTNPRTKNLFTNVEWYKYDGSTERADKNNEDRLESTNQKDPALRSLIDTDTDLTAAFEILEGSNSLDAQYILRDLKELYVELGYFEKEDLRDPVRRILRWPIDNYKTPKFWPSAEIHQDPEGYGVFIPSKATVEKMYDKEAIKENKSTVGEGFKAGVNVLSPVTGRIEKIGTKDIERLITNKDGELEKVTYKDVGYITISAIDDTAPIEAKPYKQFYESEYKGVISGKEKHGTLKEDSRYIKGNKITIEGLKVGMPTDVNNEKNSRYIKQLKSSDLKKIQDKGTKEVAEAIENEKVEAPNYIKIGFTTIQLEIHVGDYIKEGTIFGQTTESDIRIIMEDTDKAFVENVDKYSVVNPGFYIEIMEDYYTKTEEGEPNIIDDAELFAYMLSEYPNLAAKAQELIDMQEKYQVNAIYAAAVAVIESSGGNVDFGLDYHIRTNINSLYNNIFSIQGKHNGGVLYDTGMVQGPQWWDVYTSYEEAFEKFAELMHSGKYWGSNRYYVSEISPYYCGGNWGELVNKQITAFLIKGRLKLHGGGGKVGPSDYIWPLPAEWNYITSILGYRANPFNPNELQFHGGIDISVTTGIPIYAIAAGTVSISKDLTDGYGKHVVVDHGGGIVSYYGHMSQRKVEVGDKVTQGDVVGLVGNTGFSSGDHLHLEIRVNGVPTDPFEGFLEDPGTFGTPR